LCAALLADVAASGILTEGGLVLVQHDRRQPLPESHPPLHRQDERLYGDSLLSVYALVDGLQADGAMADEALDDETPDNVEDESHRDEASGG